MPPGPRFGAGGVLVVPPAHEGPWVQGASLEASAASLDARFRAGDFHVPRQSVGAGSRLTSVSVKASENILENIRHERPQPLASAAILRR